MIDTKVVKISLSADVEGTIVQTCGIYGADGWRLGGVITVVELNHALLIFQKYASTDPTTTSGQGS